MKNKLVLSTKTTVMLLLCILLTSSAFSQQREIIGKIKNSENVPIPNVSILFKGTNVGSQSNNEGEFAINIPSEGTLIFSVIGYQSQEIETNGKKSLNVILQAENVGIDEVVVMGYSRVEKQHVASSVAQLDMDKTKSRPIFKMQEAFSGTIPGVTMLQGSNMPGAVPGTISIRGISTLQNADALVIVDGMEQSITDIDPNQIKSVTVLKDAASTSMYGSRGANGVIIIETERGYTGQFKVDLNSWAAVSSPLDLPNWVNAADYMKLNNETRSHQGQSLLFTEEDISKAESGELKSVNWLDEIITQTPLSKNTTANISGGGGVGTFNLMLGYIDEKGLNEIEGTNKFSARFNTNINIADRFVLLADFYAHRLQIDRLMANDNGHGLYQLAWRMNPTQQLFYESELPDHYILHNNMNPLASLEKGGIKNYLHDRSTINLRPRYNINKNLNLEGNISYMINKSANKAKRNTFKFFDGDGAPVTIWNNSVTAEQGVSASQLTARGLLNYTKDLREDQDKIYLTLGSEMMAYTYTDYREENKASFFGKLNYSFGNRYLVELTGRSDGSSKFAPGHKWGFFPSAALAWNLHNESFFSTIRESGIINNLKFRGSYGLIGNENVDPYLWQEIVNNWGWTTRVPNPNFSWEKQKQWNVGLDLTALNNKFSLTGEIYNKFSYDLIYGNFPVPPLTGSNTLESAVNIGEVENKGWEISANWSDEIGKVSYSVGGMLFDNVNKVLKAGYSNSDTLVFKGDSDKIWFNGIALDNYYGFVGDGFFQNQEEVDNTAAKLPNTLPGDIKYLDQNSDGIINDQDRVNLGDPFPHLNYSLNFNLKYSNWDFSFLGQGVGRRTGRLAGMEGYPVYVDGDSNSLGTPREEYVDNRWTAENPNARFPRIWSGASSNAYLSNVWLSNAAFFRVKMLQLGYTFPKIGKSIQDVRIYMNAQDLFTITNFEGLEPERNGSNGGYPRMASYSLGIRAIIF